ncbi:MAG: CPBP family intramembrane metalloprotease [Caldilineaceae bacterium SB0675_bin_29]|uniref:CPBP family intramembrane metalloprotease n=1 Tax=Caldilineaceae bacterium SB0675_bin_29 TaxID=2605266 RepID=A0A6B1G2Z6_9CHLR|nr:CPBP family intramembrane metalloprotease [Caldilineaceae bacterium SB0675_bin_29]
MLPFWNSDDRRLRAGWRLILHVILVAVVIVALEVLFSLAFEDLEETFAFGIVQMALSGLAIVAGTLLAARFLDRRPVSDLGLQFSSHWWRDLGYGLFLGAFLMLLIFLVELALGWVTVEELLATNRSVPFALAILWPLTQFLAVGIYEELVSRGYHFKNLAEGLSFSPLGRKRAILLAWFISSAVFGLLHAFNPNATVISTVNLFLAGLFLGLPFLLTDQLAMPIGIHITWNFFQGNVFGFPVSGTSNNETTFIAVQQGGPDLWTGGAFGPEAGVLGLAAIVVGSLLIVWWVKRTRGAVGFALAVAEYQSPANSESVAEQPPME